MLDSKRYLLSQVSLRSLLHFSQNHSRDFLRGESLHLTGSDVQLDVRLVLLLNNLEETRQVFSMSH